MLGIVSYTEEWGSSGMGGYLTYHEKKYGTLLFRSSFYLAFLVWFLVFIS